MARRKTGPRAWVRVSHKTKDLPASKRRWEVVYEDPNNGYKRRTKGGFASKAAAEEWSADFTQDARRGEWVDPARGDALFRDVATQWLPTYVPKRGKVRGQRQHEQIITGKGSLLMNKFGETRIGDITPAQVALWVNSLDRAPNTVRHYFYTLRLVMKYAQANGIIRRDPTQGIALPEPRKMKDEEADRYPLTLAEALKLAAAVPEPWDMYVRLAAATGMRPEELGGLHLSDYKPGDQTLTVRRVVVIHKGQPMIENVAKTSDSHRTVELDDETAKLLEDYIERHRARATAWFAANPEHKHPGEALPLFVGVGAFKRGQRQRKNGTDVDWLDYSRLLKHGWFYMRHWDAARKAAGVPEAVRFYDLRHMHASLLVGMLGQPGAMTLTEVAERLGHSPALLLSRYAHSPRDRRQAKVDAVNALMTPVTDDNVVPLHKPA
ncbi:tyrosine-type recombinase/integrase [Nocardioides mangrovi]|uniref:Tyrosine-type recombinase/integrase n=1 Tax=Nocardioides mangrovi TaxID=2874580 RepID=A0ABS7UGP5_9ACTN|nr:tyrosine-type recombinase/integrase [Nocardioides mangrovi]MBZ5739767.1 tyrosine-type recombinase/integrase [Nocardioides mangrovi]